MLLRYLFFFVFSVFIHHFAFSFSDNQKLSYALTKTQKSTISIQLVEPNRGEKVVNDKPEEPIKEQKIVSKAIPKKIKEIVKSSPKEIEKKVEVAQKTIKKNAETTVKKRPKITKEIEQKKQTIKTENLTKPEEKTSPKERHNPKKTEEPIQTATAEKKIKQSSPKMVSKPTFSARPAPIAYPHSAQKRNMEGSVLIEVWLDEQGKQTQQRIINSSGHQILDKAALQGISQWQFSRKQDAGQAIAYRVQVPINFGLN